MVFFNNISFNVSNNKKILNEAYDLISKNCYEDALVILNKLLDENYDKVNVLVGIFKVYLHYKDYSKCLEYIDEALKINPNSFNALFHKGLLFTEMNNYSEALDYYNKAINTNNVKTNYAILLKIDSLIKLNRYDEAYNLLKDIKNEGFESDGFFWNFKGNNYFYLSMFTEAIDCYKKAINLNFDLYSSYYNLGNCFSQLKQYKNALDSYNIALIYGLGNIDLFYNKGLALYYLKDYEGALDSYNIALDLDSKNNEVLNNKGIVLVDMGKLQEALVVYKYAHNLFPDDMDVLLNMIIILYDLGYFKDTIFYSNQILKRDVNNFQVLLYKANALKGLKRYDEALICYDKALSVKEDEDVIREKEELLLLIEDK